MTGLARTLCAHTRFSGTACSAARCCWRFGGRARSVLRAGSRAGIMWAAVWGSVGSGACGGASAQSVQARTVPLARPTGIVFDPQRNLYVAETNNHAIRRVDTAGVITTVAGSGVQGFGGMAGRRLRRSATRRWDCARRRAEPLYRGRAQPADSPGGGGDGDDYDDCGQGCGWIFGRRRSGDGGDVEPAYGAGGRRPWGCVL